MVKHNVNCAVGTKTGQNMRPGCQQSQDSCDLDIRAQLLRATLLHSYLTPRKYQICNRD